MKDKDSAFLDDLEKTTDLLKSFKPRISEEEAIDLEPSFLPERSCNQSKEAFDRLLPVVSSSEQSVEKLVKKKKIDIASLIFCLLSIIFILSCIFIYGSRFIIYHHFFLYYNF